jgi:DNA replication protein DnaD
MSRAMIAYSKSILESVSFDSVLFCKELQKAVKMLLPYEIEELAIWFFNFTKEKPELRHCQIYLNI